MRNQLRDVKGQEHELPCPPSPVVIGYGERGQEVAADDLKCVAKRSFDPSTKTTRFLVKRGNDGSFYDPNLTMFSRKSPYYFRAVGKEAFELYLKFLKTGNAAYVRCAERCSNG